MKLSILEILLTFCIFNLQVKFQYATEVEIDAETADISTRRHKSTKKRNKDPKSKNDLADATQNGKEKVRS